MFITTSERDVARSEINLVNTYQLTKVQTQIQSNYVNAL